MKSCLHRAIIVCIFLCFGRQVHAQSDTVVFEPVKRFLDALRHQDDLESWIYNRIDYVDANPAVRLKFLMQTQEEAWRKYKTYNERIAWFNLLATQGYYQLQSGNVLASIAAYENALQFYESYPLPDADIIEYVLKPLGNNYTRLADYNTALFIHQKTLTAALKKGDRNTIASVYSNMAACARWKGDLAQAAKFCQEGISYVDRKKFLYGLLLSTYADVLAVQERYDTAAIVIAQSLRQLKPFGNDMQAMYWFTSALQIASRIALHEMEFDRAMQFANSALLLFDKYYPGLRQRERAKIFVLLGDITQRTRAYELALAFYQDALELLLPAWHPRNEEDIPSADLFYSENTFGDALAGKAEVLKASGREEEALSHYLACFAAEKKLRAAFFYTESKYRELAITRSRSNAAMRTAHSLWTKTKQQKYLDQMLLIAELSKAQVLADERIARLAPAQNADTLTKRTRQLQEAINYYQHEAVDATDKKAMHDALRAAEYELAMLLKKIKQPGEQDEELLSVEAIYTMLRKMPQGITLLEFFEGENFSYIIEADAKGIHNARVIEGATLSAGIRQFTQHWFFNGPIAIRNAPKKFYEASAKLCRQIFFSYRWQKDRRYILVPDGLFNYLPFDALVTDSLYQANFASWSWLFKQADLSRAWSLQTWHQQQTAQYSMGTFSGFFVSAGKQAKLAVEDEYNSLRPLVKGDYFVNDAATWQQFNRAADSASVLHIGSHAMMTSDDSIPFLQLSDKPFYLFDLRYKNFSPALVVLGACKTADGLLLQGEGVNSLSRGFTAAGAGGVVSGLWNVNDETAIAFMQVFYKKLGDHDAAFALQEAKRQWLEEHADDPALQLPYYWAGFVYNGHLQPIKLENRNGEWWWYAGAVAVLGLGAVLFRFVQLRKRRDR